jgi:hypothetical protein
MAAVSVRIGGIPAEVLYAGAAPGLVSGVLQVNVRIPNSAPGAFQSLEVTVGNATSQPGVVIAVAGTVSAPGTGPQIEVRLQELRRQRTPAVLPELPSDRDALPANWLGLISWNIQVGGTSPTSGSLRPPMVQAALGRMFNGSYQILAAQEISSTDNADMLREMLPGGTAAWTTAFTDTSDSMDNGFWYRPSVVMRDSFALLTTSRRDAAGRPIADDTRALHPPQVAQFEIGDLDFTLINVHLTFADGDTSESVRELRNVLDYLDWYFDQPDHDPDVIVAVTSTRRRC